MNTQPFRKLSGSEFKSSCSHLNFRFRTCFEQGVPWHSGNYKVWIHSEMCTWHNKNIQSIPLVWCKAIRICSGIIWQCERRLKPVKPPFNLGGPMHSFLQGWNPPFWKLPLFMKQIKSYALLTGSHWCI